MKELSVPRVGLCEKGCRGGTDMSVKITCKKGFKIWWFESGAHVAKTWKERRGEKQECGMKERRKRRGVVGVGDALT